MAKTIRLRIPKSKPNYKYAINDQMALLPRSWKVKDVITHLEKEGITRNEFYADRDIPFGSEKSISSDRLLIYTQVFECSIEDLMNHTIDAKPIRAIVREKSKSGLR